MEERVKISETYPKSEQIITFYPQFSYICRPYTVLAIKLNQTAMFWLQHFKTSISLVNTYNRRKSLKYKKYTPNLKKLHKFISYFVYLGTFTAISIAKTSMISLGYTNMRNPVMGTVLHW